MKNDLIELTTKGLYCAAGGFHIDPSRAVDVAVITHAHSDHARKGSKRYYCTSDSVSLVKHRLGANISITGIPYGQPVSINGVRVSFHPAGHILGSAQVRVEYASQVWAVSGDYKREPDPTCKAFEVVPCDTFITEATFGNPKYRWSGLSRAGEEIYEWWQTNRAKGRNSLLYCYALGKTQRVLAELRNFTREAAYTFGEASDLTECYRMCGVDMIPTRRLESIRSGECLSGELIVAPHSIANTSWLERLGPASTAFASGWMQSGAFGSWRRYDRGFVLSDHADWPDLIRTVQETGARRVLVQHAKDGHLTKYLRKLGIDAQPLLKPSTTPSKHPWQPDLFQN